MGNCNSCPSKNNCGKQATCTIENNPNNKIKNIIGIMSGKGGVGKSTVTSLIAKKLNKEVFLYQKIDESLIGGIKVVISDYVFDASIKHKLDSLKNTLQERG